MKGLKKSALLLVLLFCFSLYNATAQTDWLNSDSPKTNWKKADPNAKYTEVDYKKDTYDAFISGEMQDWASIIYCFEKEKTAPIERRLELIGYVYGYTAYLIGKKDFVTAKKYIVKGKKLIKDAFALSPDNATAYAFKGAFVGLEMAINSKAKAAMLAPKSAASINKACKLESNNVQAIVDKGNLMYHSPALIGGDKQDALVLYRQGVQLMEAKNDIQNNWFYLSVLTTIARTYEEFNQIELAKQTYEKILSIEPEYLLVKDNLYPTLVDKIPIW